MLEALFVATTLNLGLPPKLLSSLCHIESDHRIHVINHDDGGSASFGICQIKLNTAKWLGFNGTAKDLMRPEVNILYAGKYLKYQLRRYNGDVYKAVIAYNRGNANNLTTSHYQRKVFNKWSKNEQYKKYFRGLARDR